MFTNSCMCSKVWPKVCALASETQRERERVREFVYVCTICLRVCVCMGVSAREREKKEGCIRFWLTKAKRHQRNEFSRAETRFDPKLDFQERSPISQDQ